MLSLALQQVSSPFARTNARRTLEKRVALRYITPYIAPEVSAELALHCSDGAAFIWGAKPERGHQTHKILGRNSLFLFRRGPLVYRVGVAIAKTVSVPLAMELWGRDPADGHSWSTVFFFDRLDDRNIKAAELNVKLGRSESDNWQGLVAVEVAETEANVEFFRRRLISGGGT